MFVGISTSSQLICKNYCWLDIWVKLLIELFFIALLRIRSEHLAANGLIGLPFTKEWLDTCYLVALHSINHFTTQCSILFLSYFFMRFFLFMFFSFTKFKRSFKIRNCYGGRAPLAITFFRVIWFTTPSIPWILEWIVHNILVTISGPLISFFITDQGSTLETSIKIIFGTLYCLINWWSYFSSLGSV